MNRKFLNAARQLALHILVDPHPGQHSYSIQCGMLTTRYFIAMISFYCSACFSLNLCLTLLLCVLYFLLHLHSSDYVNEGFSFSISIARRHKQREKSKLRALEWGEGRTREIREVLFDDWMEKLFHLHKHITHHSLPSEIKTTKATLATYGNSCFRAFISLGDCVRSESYFLFHRYASTVEMKRQRGGEEEITRTSWLL